MSIPSEQFAFYFFCRLHKSKQKPILKANMIQQLKLQSASLPVFCFNL